LLIGQQSFLLFPNAVPKLFNNLMALNNIPDNLVIQLSLMGLCDIYIYIYIYSNLISEIAFLL